MQRLLIFGLIASTLCCYLEWADQSVFLFQIEYSLFVTSDQQIEAFAHPLIILPICGQLLLLIVLVFTPNNLKLVYIGTTLISLLVAMILFVGVVSMNLKIIASTMPFLLMFGLIVSQNRRKRPKVR